MSATGQKRGGTFGENGRGTEGTGNHELMPLPMLRLSSELFCSDASDVQSGFEIQTGPKLDEGLAPAIGALHQQAARLGPNDGEDESGNAASGPEVEEIAPQVVDARREVEGVGQLCPHIAGPQKSPILCRFQHRQEFAVCRRTGDGGDHNCGRIRYDRRITTRRRGSSPSDPVDTPS